MRWCAAIAVGLALQAIGGVAQAQEGERKAFRVCKDPNNMPFSNKKGEGFEDRIAELFAHDLGLPLEQYTFPQRLGFIRNTLRFKLPGEDYPCDIVMGVPAGWGQVMSTKAYYRSTYVLVFPAVKGLEGVKTEADFLGLPPEKLAQLKIGVFDRSPASQWLARHNLVDAGVPYQMMNANPDYYPGQIVEQDLANGKIDVAVVWGPIGGYFAKRSKGEAPLRVVPLASEPGVQFDYAMAMGVRYGEKAWKEQIEGLIDRNRDKIMAILDEYGVPRVEESSSAKTAMADTDGARH